MRVCVCEPVFVLLMCERVRRCALRAVWCAGVTGLVCASESLWCARVSPLPFRMTGKCIITTFYCTFCFAKHKKDV